MGSMRPAIRVQTMLRYYVTHAAVMSSNLLLCYKLVP